MRVGCKKIEKFSMHKKAIRIFTFKLKQKKFLKLSVVSPPKHTILIIKTLQKKIESTQTPNPSKTSFPQSYFSHHRIASCFNCIKFPAKCENYISVLHKFCQSKV